MEENIINIIKKYLVKPSDIVQDDLLDTDSITFIKIVVELEETFNIEFDDEMLLITKFPSVKSMIEYVELKTTKI